ncbi:hypothetical protein [Bradyrhizobium brasilense]|uniref:hypothetical protein n=1 Tax=Bradyrhizobium brasilense TaxID=1419277 RepID=UPI00115FC721|nr:hypothetical protein [Bradyrhizobium brasilense]
MNKNADLLVAAQHRKYLRDVLKKLGKKPTPFAKEIGVAPSTLTRVYNGEDGAKGTLRATTLARLESASGIAAPTAELPEGERPQAQRLPDAVPFIAKSADSELARAIRELTGGRNSIEAWTIQSRALECAGFLPGDVVLIDLSAISRAQDAVLAMDFRGGGEGSALTRIHEPPYLVTATLEPGNRKPLEVDDEWVIVKGVILPHRLRARPS